MAVQHYPEGNRKYVEFVRSWQPNGSQTRFWVQDMTTNTMVYMLKWGKEIYLPTYEGMHLGLGIYNGRSNHVAYPTYVEAANIWTGGPSEPELCNPDHMWELQPFQRMVMDALMNTTRQAGRPLIITRTGAGFTIGEATFGTDAFRGQVRVYERIQLGGGYQYQRRTNEGSAVSRGSTPRGGLYRESNAKGLESMTYGAESLGLGVERGETERGGHAGIGAGEEEHRSHSYTGVTYQRQAEPVISLRVEYREDLHGILAGAWGTRWDWSWPLPSASTLWWEDPWIWNPGHPPTPTAPYIPVTPHTGRH